MSNSNIANTDVLQSVQEEAVKTVMDTIYEKIQEYPVLKELFDTFMIVFNKIKEILAMFEGLLG